MIFVIHIKLHALELKGVPYRHSPLLLINNFCPVICIYSWHDTSNISYDEKVLNLSSYKFTSNNKANPPNPEYLLMIY